MQNPSLFEVQSQLAHIEVELNKALPNIATSLRDIHRKLASDPDLVTILTPEECSLLVRGLINQTNTTMLTKAVKATKAGLKNTTLDDL